MNRSTLYKKLTNKKHNIGFKYILSLLITFVGLISFGYCDNTIGYYGSLLTFRAGDTAFPVNGNNCFSLFGYSCYQQFNAYDKDGNLVILSGVVLSDGHTFAYQDDIFCFNGTGKLYQFYDGGCRWELHNIPFPEVCPTCPSQYTSEECQSEYGLVSSGLLNNCENNYNNCQTELSGCQSNTSGFNELLNNCSNSLNACNNSLTSCLQQNCPETTTGINRSSLFINNIQYPGAPTIKFTIPEEIERDQYTDEEETNIDVIGYGYDQNKMQQMVNTQYYKPTSEEMSQLVEKIADFLPLVAVALLIIRIRRVLKKVFRF